MSQTGFLSSYLSNNYFSGVKINQKSKAINEIRRQLEEKPEKLATIQIPGFKVAIRNLPNI